MALDMRCFIDLLQKDFPQEIAVVDGGPLRPAQGECTALLHHLLRRGKRPMVVFNHVTDLKEGRWHGSVAFQLAGTWTKIGAGYGIPRDQMDFPRIQLETAERVKRQIPPLAVEEKEAPVKRNVIQREEVDLFSLPGYISHDGDARPGNITGVLVARDPDSGRVNLSWHRNRVFEKDKLVVAIGPDRHLWQIMEAYRQKGEESVPVAQVFGHHVLFGLAAAINIGLDVDEYAFTGGIFGEPLRITPSTTWGKALMIPADAEVVIEGTLSLTEKAEAGLWGDHFRYYTAPKAYPVMRVTTVNMREHPIFEHTWVGRYVYSDLAHSSFLRSYLCSRFDNVGPINPAGPSTYIIQFKPNKAGDVQRLVAMAHGYGSHVKHVIVVDEDIDPFDLPSVFWSIAARVDASRSVWVAHHLTAASVDPSAREGLEKGDGVGGLVIDSTVPIGRPFLEMARLSDELLSRIKLSDFVSEEVVNKLSEGSTTRPWSEKI